MSKSSSITVTVQARLDSASDGAGTGFLQRRVANAGRFGVTLAWSFALLRAVMLLSAGAVEKVSEPTFGLHVASGAPFLLLWLLCRRGQHEARVLLAAEMATMLVGGALLVGMGAFMPLIMRPDLIVLLALTIILVARAVYVPSTWRRTLLLGALLTMPFFVMVHHAFGTWPPNLLAEARLMFREENVEVLRWQQVVLAMSWWMAAVATSVAASRVIYGLREQVREVQKLGQYQLEEKLGEGGMGIVYRARHALLQRPTAVKLLPLDRVGEKALERFEREVRQTARLAHPNTITVYDYGRTPEGIFYYAMELLDGVTLDRVVEATGPMPPARVVHLLRQAAASLAEAHSMGLVHRDIKPANIMLCELAGVPDTVKVLDFGLVKEASRGGDDVRLTGENVVMGTPQFMAPETIRGPDHVDARADLYGLAATGYYLVTGRDVFQAESVLEICSHHLRSAPQPPSELVAGLPADLEAILLRCLAKDPAERPRDGRQLGTLLAACGDAGAWTEEMAGAWWRAHGHRLARPGGVSTSAPTLAAPDGASLAATEAALPR